MKLREMLAALEHDQWAHWTRYMLANLTPENIERWKRQVETPYSELSEKEKDSDREWADKVFEELGSVTVDDFLREIWRLFKEDSPEDASC